MPRLFKIALEAVVQDGRMRKENDEPRVYIIGHPSFAERYRYIVPHVQRIMGDGAMSVGVVGANLSPEELAKHAPALSPGQIGCALSHVVAYEDMIESGVEKAIVIEDDAVLPEDFMALAKQVLKQLREGEIISFHSPTMGPSEMSIVDAQLFGGSKLVTPMNARLVRSTLCYAIHRDAAYKIAAQNRPVRYVADNFMKFYEQGYVQYLRIFSPAVVQVAEFRSTIGYLQGRLAIQMLSSILNSLPISKQMLAHRRVKLRELRDKNHIFVNVQSELSGSNPNYKK